MAQVQQKSVQIFGMSKSQATRAAERFFKERRIQIHFVDLTQKSMSAGEMKRFIDKFTLQALIDREGKAYVDAGLQYMRVPDPEMLRKIEQEPKLLKMPLIRCGNLLSVGHDEAAWRQMLA